MQQLVRSMILMFSNVPRRRRSILGFFIIFSIIVPIWKILPYYRSPTFTFKNMELNKKIYSLFSVNVEPIGQSVNDNKINLKNDLCKEKEIAEKLNFQKHAISIENTVGKVLNQNSIDINNTTNIPVLGEKGKNIKIIQQLSWILTTNKDLQHLTWKISQCKIRTCNYINNNFNIKGELHQDSWINRVINSTIGNRNIDKGSFTSKTIITVLNGMRWKMDLRKLKKGDKFSVLMYRELVNGKRKQSQLVGMHLRSGGKDYYAIRAKNGKFYDHNGTSLAHGFLRFPTKKTFRISSNFNLRRLHPVTGRVSPHRGVDFAMPQGTPVLSVGDGEVIAAKHNNAAGFYIAVRHGHIYTTRYMHLYKLLVKPGQKVRKGDLIALSGNTGNSTGPHLHYEVWINQRAVNPLTVKLPRTERLTGKDRYNYLTQVKEITSQLRFD